MVISQTRPPPLMPQETVLRACGLNRAEQALFDPGEHRFADLGVAAGTAAALALAALFVTVPASRVPLALVLAVAVVGLVSVLVANGATAVIAVVVLGVPSYALWMLMRLFQAADGPGIGLGCFAFSALVLAYAATRSWRRFRRRQLALRPIEDLLVETERYNRLVRAFEARQALAEAEGVPLDAQQRQLVSQTLNDVYLHLKRAGAVARILRTHRDVLCGGDDRLRGTKPFAAAGIESRAAQNIEDLDRTLQAAVAAQTELAQLSNRHG